MKMQRETNSNVAIACTTRTTLFSFLVINFIMLQLLVQNNLSMPMRSTSISQNEDDMSMVNATIANETNEDRKSNQMFQTTFQFPSVEERIEFYMGSWHTKNLTIPSPDSSSSESLLCKDLYIATPKSEIKPETTTFYSLTTLQKRYQMPKLFHSVYLKDTANILSHVESRIDQEKEDEERYVMLKPGDGYSTDEHKPVVAKTRRYEKQKEDQGEDYYRPIVWPIRLKYHFTDKLNALQKIKDSGKDTPWEKKKEVVVWRGVCTGVKGIHTSKGFRLEFTQKHKDNEQKKVDIAMINSCRNFEIAKNITVDPSFFRPRMSMEKLLEHKYLLNLEGNDVSTGLKWMLASSSVVFMPTPSAVSFAMESKLVPYVHYVPVKDDGSDLLEQLEWAKKNDDRCRWISEQASAYMNDLWLSAQAQKDLILIKHMMGNIYYEKFNKALSVCH